MVEMSSWQLKKKMIRYKNPCKKKLTKKNISLKTIFLQKKK